MPTEEEVKKVQEEAERKFEERVNIRVAKEADDIRKRAEARFEAENSTLRTELKKLKDAETARVQAEEDKAIADLEELKKSVDPALVEMLPEKLSVLDQRDWLRKHGTAMPTPEKKEMPITPKGVRPQGKQPEPMPINRKII